MIISSFSGILVPDFYPFVSDDIENIYNDIELF